MVVLGMVALGMVVLGLVFLGLVQVPSSVVSVVCRPAGHKNLNLAQRVTIYVVAYIRIWNSVLLIKTLLLRSLCTGRGKN